MTYDEKTARVNEIVALMEAGDLTLEEAMRVFLEAKTLLEECEKELANAKLKFSTFQLPPSNPKGSISDE